MNLLPLLITHQNELYLLTSIAIIMAVSPGADFALVCRNTIYGSRKIGIYTTIGIATAIWLNIAYCIAGLALIISNTPIIFTKVKYIGAMYLIYLGLQSFMIGAATTKNRHYVKPQLISNRIAFINGFTSNALNPKTTLFFLSIFTQLVSSTTPVTLQLIYGAIICFTHIFWFISLSFLLSQQHVLKKIKAYEKHVSQILAIVLILFGLKVVFM